jgi:hypothetical protein
MYLDRVKRLEGKRGVHTLSEEGLIKEVQKKDEECKTE